MALAGEERALAFFKELLAAAKDPDVTRVTKELVNEESEHVQLCHRLLRRYPASGLRFGDDPDPPVPQE
jgi:rubrerythrin